MDSLILDNVSKHIHLSENEKDFFISLLEKKFLKKKDLLLLAGKVCTHSAFVLKGVLKGYTIDKEGSEHILNFAAPGWWIADMYSYFSQKPGILHIEALVDAEVFLLSYDRHQQLYETIPKFERFFRILVENALVANQQRLIDNLSLTAEERYLNFITKYPSIIECAPQHSIASYLGITPEFLSKIRARLAKRHL
jgi:CRP-like cAMP-binding protein